MKVKNKLLIFNCSDCKKDHGKDFNKDLTKRLVNTHKFYDADVNSFFLVLRKSVSIRIYEYLGKT